MPREHSEDLSCFQFVHVPEFLLSECPSFSGAHSPLSGSGFGIGDHSSPPLLWANALVVLAARGCCSLTVRREL